MNLRPTDLPFLTLTRLSCVSPLFFRDHGAGLAELLNSIVSFVRKDLGVASPLPCPEDDLSSSLDSDSDDDDLSDSDDEEEDVEGGEGGCAGDTMDVMEPVMGLVHPQPHHSCAGLPMGLSAATHPVLRPLEATYVMNQPILPLHLPAPMPSMQAPVPLRCPPPPPSSSSPPSPQFQPPVRTPSSSPPSARMTTLSDINTNGHATTLPTQHCHHSTGPPLNDKLEDDAMVIQKEAPTPAPTPQACSEAPAPRGPLNWPANAALLRYVSRSVPRS